MEVSNCCEAQFYEPGYPDNDICSACKEHASPMDDDNDEAIHTGASIVKSNKNVEGVFMQNGKIVSIDYLTYEKPIQAIKEMFAGIRRAIKLNKRTLNENKNRRVK